MGSELASLIDQLTALDEMRPLHQAEFLLELESTALAVLRRLRQQAIVRASSEQTVAKVAEYLDESPAAIQDAIARHKARSKRR